MIAFLEGDLKDLQGDVAIVMTGGVGYEVHCSQITMDDVFGKKRVALHVYTHVREDLIQLYGFSTITEKDVFLSLIDVSGIGPKMALKILSSTRVEDLVHWIEEGDVAALTKLPKIGRKTAEQILLTLKDKIGKKAQISLAPKSGGVRKDITSALINLGFSSSEVEKAVAALPSDINFTDGVRESLAHLSGHS